MRVIAGSNFWNDAAEPRVVKVLARHEARQNISVGFHNRDRGVIAARFDREHAAVKTRGAGAACRHSYFFFAAGFEIAFNRVRARSASFDLELFEITSS